MKSKFSQVVKVKKQALDLAEARVAKARNNVVICEQNHEKAKAVLAKFILPQSGTTSELNESLKLVSLMRNEIKALNEKLEISKRELMHFSHQYKNANLEYEKMKYLEQEDIKKILKQIKHKESIELDEFAVIKFSQNRDLV
ncbi:flagellar FliJ family protein [Campylobacter majalis]|uniref:flagellar FliJ family protein n=1 Tax=Campylobacter majalis TaxID=2790656 RepID=UPI003D695C1E